MIEPFSLIPKKLRDAKKYSCLSPKDRNEVLWWAHRPDHTLVPDGQDCERYRKEPLAVIDTVPRPRILAEKIGKSEFHVVAVWAVKHSWITEYYEGPMKELQ